MWKIKKKGGSGANWPAIGIDLGTTYSCVGVWQAQQNRVEIITNDLGSRTTPSWVAFTPNDRLIGEAARNQAGKNSSNTIFDAKRLIGRRFGDEKLQKDMKLWPFKVVASPDGSDGLKPMIVVTSQGEEKHFAPEEISSMILAKMKETAEAYLDSEVKNAVVTVPAYFSDAQRQATKDAGMIAGLNITRIINEPTAAAIAYSFDKFTGSKVTPKNVLIFDLGGGTFDVSFVNIEKHVVKVIAVGGNTHLGGVDFDSRMVSHFVTQFRREHKKDISVNPRALGRLRAACEKAKRLLSFTTETAIEIDCLFEGIDFSSTISRARFEMMNIDLFKDCMDVVEKCLRDANMGKNDVDDIVFVGGSTRIPKIQQMLHEIFYAKEISKSLNPDEAVAYGAALYAAIMSGIRQDKQFSLVDVAPLSLGVKLRSGGFRVVIPRNTPIPAKMEKISITASNNQTRMRTSVYEGESPIAKENNFLGDFLLRDIPPAPKGVVKVIDCFSIDANGILTVTSTEESSGKKNQITITNHSGRLSKLEFDRMVTEAKEYNAKDKKSKNAAKAKNTLENYIHEMEDTLRGYGKKINTKDKRKLGDAIEQTEQWLKWNTQRADACKFEEKIKELEGTCAHIIAKMRQQLKAVDGEASYTCPKIEIVVLD